MPARLRAAWPRARARGTAIVSAATTWFSQGIPEQVAGHPRRGVRGCRVTTQVKAALPAERSRGLRSADVRALPAGRCRHHRRHGACDSYRPCWTSSTTICTTCSDAARCPTAPSPTTVRAPGRRHHDQRVLQADLQRLGVPAERVHIAHLAVDTDALRAAARGPRGLRALPGPRLAAQEPHTAARGDGARTATTRPDIAAQHDRRRLQALGDLPSWVGDRKS